MCVACDLGHPEACANAAPDQLRCARCGRFIGEDCLEGHDGPNFGSHLPSRTATPASTMRMGPRMQRRTRRESLLTIRKPSDEQGHVHAPRMGPLRMLRRTRMGRRTTARVPRLRRHRIPMALLNGRLALWPGGPFKGQEHPDYVRQIARLAFDDQENR